MTKTVVYDDVRSGERPESGTPGRVTVDIVGTGRWTDGAITGPMLDGLRAALPNFEPDGSLVSQRIVTGLTSTRTFATVTGTFLYDGRTVDDIADDARVQIAAAFQDVGDFGSDFDWDSTGTRDLDVIGLSRLDRSRDFYTTTNPETGLPQGKNNVPEPSLVEEIPAAAGEAAAKLAGGAASVLGESTGAFVKNLTVWGWVLVAILVLVLIAVAYIALRPALGV